MNESKLIFETEARSLIKRDGIEDLLTFLHESDFYDAPASTRFHGACDAGLVEHSLEVYHWIFNIRSGLFCVGKEFPNISVESMAIVSLFHDICKIDTYKIDYRNVKNSETGKWEKEPFYKQQDDSGFGAHGAKSVFLINCFMKLSQEETVAILHHMGAWDKSTYSDPGKAYEKYPLAWLLHVADEAATYISKK